MSCDVALEPCGSYNDREVEAALSAALDRVDGLSFVRPGMLVAVKVNLVRGMKPELAATVHPSVVCALVRLLRARGADVVIGDSPGGVYSSLYVRRIYEVCGMKQAEAFGAKLNDDFSQSEADYPDAAQAKRFPYTAYLDRADAIIDLCKLKTHGMMGMSNAVKNFFGTIPGTIKPEFHYKYPRAEDFADMLVDLYEYFRPVLCVCDAVVGMEGNGPTQGTPRKIGCLMASRSGHAMDLIGAELMGLGAQDIPTLRSAIRRGLLDPAAVTVHGDAARFVQPGFQTIPAQSSVFFHVAGEGVFGRAVDLVASRILTPFPKLDAPACVGCGKCAEVCPAKAIAIKRGKARIDRNVCIHCFCCQEFCPKGAMRVGYGLLTGLLKK